MGMGEIRHTGRMDWRRQFNELKTHKTERTPSDDKKKVPKVSKEKEGTEQQEGFSGVLKMKQLELEVREKACHNDAIIESFLNSGTLKIDKNTVSYEAVGYTDKAQKSDEQFIIVRGTAEETPVTFRIWDSTFPGFYNARFIIHGKESRLIFISAKVKELLVGK